MNDEILASWNRLTFETFQEKQPIAFELPVYASSNEYQDAKNRILYSSLKEGVR